VLRFGGRVVGKRVGNKFKKMITPASPYNSKFAINSKIIFR
jgi:hypothetical protein